MALGERFKKINFRIIFQDKIFLINLFLNILFNLGIWLLIITRFKPQTEPIILHYNIYFGIDLIGEWYRIFIIPAFGIGFFFINFLISIIIHQREKVLSYFLIFSASLIQVIFFISLIFITLQNI